MKNIWKYSQVAIRSIVLITFVIAILSLGFNLYDVLFVEITPRQAGLFLDEVKSLRIEGIPCRTYPSLYLQYIDVPVEIQTINIEGSIISLRNYNPVEIVISEKGKEIGSYTVESTLDFYLSTTAKTVMMKPSENLPNYRVGLCSDGLEYDPVKRTANSLYGINKADISFELPTSTSEAGIFLGGVSRAKVEVGSASEELVLNGTTDLVLTIRHINKNEDQPYRYSINLEISGIDNNSTLNPGSSIGYQTQISQEPADFVSIESNSFTVRKPLGYVEMRGNQYQLGYSTDTVTIAAPEYQTLQLTSNFSGVTRNYQYAITGKASQIVVDDEDYILTAWEALSPEMKNAYFGLLAAIITGALGFLITNGSKFVSSIKTFIIKPLLPEPILPFPLEESFTVLHLQSGKRIAGKLIRKTGFFKGKYILVNVREWNGEYWDKPISGEVEVSSSDVEFTFRS
jgi:hypothetical protein